MKKFIMSLFGFSLFAICFYCVMIILWGEFAPGFLKKNINYELGAYGHMYSRMKEVKQTRDVDILFLGSSHAYRGFDPRIFREAGYKTFNLGSSSQTPLQTELLLKRYLDRLRPRLVIFEVYPFTFTSDGVESALDIIANDVNDRLSLSLALKQNHLKVYNALLFSWFRELMGDKENYVEDPVKKNDRYIPGGFVEKDLTYHSYSTFPKRSWNTREEQFLAFEKIIQMLHERHIKVLLVQAPVSRALYSSYTNNDAFDKKISQWGSYINFNGKTPLDDSLHFYDPDHLNRRGVEIFDEQLIDLLKKDGIAAKMSGV